MLDVLQFVFRDFATFVGCFLMLLLVCVAVSNIKLVDIHIDKSIGNNVQSIGEEKSE